MSAIIFPHVLTFLSPILRSACLLQGLARQPMTSIFFFADFSVLSHSASRKPRVPACGREVVPSWERETSVAFARCEQSRPTFCALFMHSKRLVEIVCLFLAL